MKNMKNKTIMWILGALGLTGLFFLLKKPTEPTVVAPIGVPGIPAEALPVTCRERAIALAQKQLGLPIEELTVRSLIAPDLGLTAWSLNLAAIGWNSGVINTAVADNRFLCITGISYAGTAAESIRIRVGASTVAEFSIEHVPGITTTHHIDLFTPILAQQNLPVVVDVYASAISATDNVIFEGITVEKRGMVIA